MTTYYVRRDGRDSNPGTADDAAGAWHSIWFAVESLSANDTLVVQPGLWRMSHRVTGADGTWTTTTRYTGTGLSAAVAAPGDYLYAYAPTTGQYRSYRIAAVGVGYVDLLEPAAAAGTPANRNFWVCAPTEKPQRTIAPANAATKLVLDFTGAEVDGTGLAGHIVSLSACVEWTGGRIHGNTGSGYAGIYATSLNPTRFENVELYDCDKGFWWYYRTAGGVLVRCRAHDNRAVGFDVQTAYSGYQDGLLLACRADANGTYGVLTANTQILDSLFDANQTGIGVNGYYTKIVGSIATRNTTGLAMVTPTANHLSLLNNIFYGNTGWDVNLAAATFGLRLVRHNGIGTATGFTPDATNRSDDPRLLDPAGGDYRLADASPYWTAGFANTFLAGNGRPVGPQGKPPISPRPKSIFANPTGVIFR